MGCSPHAVRTCWLNLSCLSSCSFNMVCRTLSRLDLEVMVVPSTSYHLFCEADSCNQLVHRSLVTQTVKQVATVLVPNQMILTRVLLRWWLTRKVCWKNTRPMSIMPHVYAMHSLQHMSVKDFNVRLNYWLLLLRFPCSFSHPVKLVNNNIACNKWHLIAFVTVYSTCNLLLS